MERDDRTTARRVLLATIGSAGDVHPLLGLGRALRRRGHPVTLLASPVFETRARRLGLDAIPLGTRADYVRGIHDPDLWHPTRGFRVIAERTVLPAIRNARPGQAFLGRWEHVFWCAASRAGPVDLAGTGAEPAEEQTMGVISEQDLDLRGMTFLAWADAAAPGPEGLGRAGRRAPLAARLAPAIERFAEKYGHPPTVVLVAAAEDTTGVAFPVVVRPGIGRGQVWLGTRLGLAPTGAATSGGDGSRRA